MDRVHRIGGSDFVWDVAKAAANKRKHGVRFEDAATVFTDPLFKLVEAVRGDEARFAVIGFDAGRGSCSSCTSRCWATSSESFPHDQLRDPRKLTMLDDSLKKRLSKDRPVTSITLRIPVDVVESLKAIAPHKGYHGYQTLLKAYISEGLRRDEARFGPDALARLAKALKKRGVSKKVLDEALKEVAA